MNIVQILIMNSVSDWVKVQKGPIPVERILHDVVGKDESIQEDNVRYHLRALQKKGYLRTTCMRTKSASYVRLRGL